jgi:hypothetical protein
MLVQESITRGVLCYYRTLLIKPNHFDLSEFLKYEFDENLNSRYYCNYLLNGNKDTIKAIPGNQNFSPNSLHNHPNFLPNGKINNIMKGTLKNPLQLHLIQQQQQQNLNRGDFIAEAN